MIDDDHWADYNDHQLTLGRGARPLLREALELVGPGVGRTALDLGCGAGVESLALAQAGWQVVGIDLDAAAPERFARYADPELAGRVQIRVLDLSPAAALPRADLVHASYSLPYVGADALRRVWARVEEAVPPGGWFVGQLFGDRDSFNDGTGAQAFLRREEAEQLLAAWELLRFDEEDEEGPSFSGPKHWHVFHVIARRRPGA